jgi:signal transduction histidine kinase
MRALRLLLWPAGAALGLAAESRAFEWSELGDWLPDLATGWTLIACGLVGWSRRPESRSGALMSATGFAWFAGNFAAAGLYLHRGPLMQLVLCFPQGRARGRIGRAVVALAYAASLLPAIWRSELGTFVLAALGVSAAAHAWAGAVGMERRMRLSALRATAFLAAVLAGTAAARLAFPAPETDDATLLVYEAALCVLAIGLLAALIRKPWERSRVTDLVVDLGDSRSGLLRDALASALGDPTLEIGYRVGEHYVDARGRPIALPAAGSERTVTPVERDGEVIAVLVHDPAVLDDPGLSDALAGAARLAASNARLQSEVLGQLAELRASRRRLVRAGDEARRRLEQRLRDTVVQRLTGLARALEANPADSAPLQAVGVQLVRSLDELRELGAGIHPGGRDDGALDGALASLVADSPVPVELSVPGARLPEEVATAAYFLCSEALANAVKYARASRVTIALKVGDELIQVEVRDDGIGGADPDGAGLRGLADRVEALGGRLVVDSPAGGGTRLTADLPVADQPRRGP